MPDEKKAQQTSKLAAMIPQIMNALGGGDAKTAALLAQQRQINQEQVKNNNMRSFMRAVTSPDTGEITSESIMKYAQMFNVDQQDAMKVINDFSTFKKSQAPANQTVSAELPSGRVNTQSIGGNAPIPGGYLPGTITGSAAKTATTPTPKGFGSSAMGIFNKDTGAITHKAPTSASSITEKLSPLALLIKEKNALPEGSPDIKTYTSAIRNKSSSGRLTANDIGVNDAAEGILKGHYTLGDFEKRGSFPSRVVSRIAVLEPDFNYAKSKANLKHMMNQGNLTSLAIINGLEPLFDALLEKGKALNNSSLQFKNVIVNFAKEQLGDPDVVAFNNLRDDLLAETEKALMGSGVLSDSKYNRAIDNLKTSMSYPQLKAAVKQVRFVIESKKEALRDKPYHPHEGESAENYLKALGVE